MLKNQRAIDSTTQWFTKQKEQNSVVLVPLLKTLKLGIENISVALHFLYRIQMQFISAYVHTFDFPAMRCFK